MSNARSSEYDDKRDETPLPPEEKDRPASAELGPNEARGGSTHHNMRYVLAISTITLAVIFAALWLFWVAKTPVDTTPAATNPATTVPLSSEPASPPGAEPPSGPPPADQAPAVQSPPGEAATPPQ